MLLPLYSLTCTIVSHGNHAVTSVFTHLHKFLRRLDRCRQSAFSSQCRESLRKCLVKCIQRDCEIGWFYFSPWISLQSSKTCIPIQTIVLMLHVSKPSDYSLTVLRIRDPYPRIRITFPDQFWIQRFFLGSRDRSKPFKFQLYFKMNIFDAVHAVICTVLKKKTILNFFWDAHEQ